jgi:hypothetical protein
MTPIVFDADTRTKQREQGGLLLDGVTYPPRLLTNKVNAEVREIGRAQARVTRELEQIRRPLEEQARLRVLLEEVDMLILSEGAASRQDLLSQREETSRKLLELDSTLTAERIDEIDSRTADLRASLEHTNGELVAVLLDSPADGSQRLTADEIMQRLDLRDLIPLTEVLTAGATGDINADASESSQPDPTTQSSSGS